MEKKYLEIKIRKEKNIMTQEQYTEKVLNLKKEFNTLRDELWKNKNVRNNTSSKDWLLDNIIEDMFYAEKGEDTIVQLEDVTKCK